MPYGNNMINQLYRQKDNIENMIAQYANPQPAPVQNIINTSTSTNDTEIKYLSKNDDVNNIIIMKKTVFIDEYNNKIMIKELDGTISKSYDIIVPKDEKDLKIEELENKRKELEEKINDKYSKLDVSIDDVKPTSTNVIKPIKSATATNF